MLSCACLNVFQWPSYELSKKINIFRLLIVCFECAKILATQQDTKSIKDRFLPLKAISFSKSISMFNWNKFLKWISSQFSLPSLPFSLYQLLLRGTATKMTAADAYTYHMNYQHAVWRYNVRQSALMEEFMKIKKNNTLILLD